MGMIINPRRRQRTVYESLQPDSLRIETKMIHGDTWLLDYTEGFCEEKWKKGLGTKDYIITNIKKALGDHGSLEVDEENRTLTLKLQGPKKLIFNMLVGEFIALSTLGDATIRDLMGLIGYTALPRITLSEGKEK